MTDNPLTKYKNTIECICDKETNTVIMTVLNYGYIMYTLNMLKSLEKWGLDKKVLLICLDETSHAYFQKKGYTSICIQTSLKSFETYDNANFRMIMFYKIMLIGKLLELSYNVYYTDGDIVYCKNPLNALAHTIDIQKNEHDMWIQNDTQIEGSSDILCAGLFYARSNATTCSLFDLNNSYAMSIITQSENSDQAYLNNYIKPRLRFSVLPLTLYPNGQVFYGNPALKKSCILVHFNWIKGHEKMAKMKEHGMWLLTEDEEEEI